MNAKLSFVLAIALAMPFATLRAQGDSPTAATVGLGEAKQLATSDWRFVDIDGKQHAPFDRSECQAMVLVFISADCPIANSYQPLLRDLADQFAPRGIDWFQIHPSPILSEDQAREHRRKFDINVSIVIDRDQSIARRASATVTPEVFVYQRGVESPVYQGRIDDWYADFGKKRVAATTHELADVLEAVVAGEPVSVSKTQPVGCFISLQQQEVETNNAYDPLKVDSAEIEQVLLTVEDAARSREIPIRVYLPRETNKAPVVLFSHGLGGSRDNSAYLGKHWAGRGYVAVFMQHQRSDESVWKEAPQGERLNALRSAANGENFKLRVKDVPAVIDQLQAWNQEQEHPLAGRLDLDRIGMSGHSFGAVTTQAVSGQTFLGRAMFTDSRIKAAVAMSPSAPGGFVAERMFGQVNIPWLLLTGTEDNAMIGNADLESRFAVFPALPPGQKYELVLDKAEHSAFSDRALPGDKERRNPNHHRAILATTTAFWDACLKGDSAARNWLDGDSVRQVLEPADRWQTK